MELSQVVKATGLPMAVAKEALKDASMRCLEEVSKAYRIKFSPKLGVTYVDTIKFYDSKNDTYYGAALCAYRRIGYHWYGAEEVPDIRISDYHYRWNYTIGEDRWQYITHKERYHVDYIKNNLVLDADHPGNYLKLSDYTTICVDGIGYINRDRTKMVNLENFHEINNVYYHEYNLVKITRVSNSYYGGICENTSYVLKSYYEEHKDEFWTCPECGRTYKIEEKPKICPCQDMIIYGYHCWDGTLEFKSSTTETNPKMFFGTEIETEGSKANRLFVSQMRDIFHLERDGSLGSESFEMISQPMTWDYIMENKERFAKMFQDLMNNGQKSHETTTCGLHVHVSRTAFVSDFAINRFVAIINCLQTPMEVFARRDSGKYCRYQYLPQGPTESEFAGIIKTGHNTAVNCGEHSDNNNTDTIEVRIFKGTLNINTYLATIEFVKNIVEIANKEHMMRVKFKDLIFGKYVPNYCKERESRSHNFNYEDYVDFAKWHNYNSLKVRNQVRKDFDSYLNGLVDKGLSATMIKRIVDSRFVDNNANTNNEEGGR